MTNAECSKIISDAMGIKWYDHLPHHNLDAFSPEGFVECLEWAQEQDWWGKFYRWSYKKLSLVTADYLRFVFNRHSFGCILAEWLVKKGG